MPTQIESPPVAQVAFDSTVPAQARGPRLQLWQVCMLSTAIFLLYAPVLLKLASDWWRNPDYSHGFLIPVFVAYVVWNKGSAASALSAVPHWAGLGLVVMSIGILFIGSLGAELFLARVSLIGVLVGVVLYFRGWPTLRILAFPLAALLLMIPLPTIIYNELVFPLQLLASKLAAGCLQHTHIVPVLREGNILILPGLRLEVVEACSGIRSLVSLVTLSVIYGYFAESRTWMRVALVVLMLPVAVLANSARVLFTAIASQVWGGAVAEGWRHELSGLVSFLVATGFLLSAHAIFKRLIGRAQV
jgi:exosortase